MYGGSSVMCHNSNHGYDRREVVSEGGDVIRIRIIFWSVPVIELLEQLQISPA